MTLPLNPEISLVLCTYGPVEPLELFLQALPEQDCHYELILVDQNPDSRVEQMMARFPEIRYRLLRSKPGLSRARNVGLRVASSPVIAFPDDDCAYTRGTLRRILSFFASNQNAGILSGETSSDLGILKSTCKELSARPVADSIFLRETPSFSIFIDRTKLPGRQAWDFFDEQLGVGAPFGAAEETDYVYTLIQAGMHPYRSRACFTYHPDKEIQHSNLRRATNYGLGAGAFFRKHMTANPAFLIMAARAFLGPAVRVLHAALRREWIAAEYHTRTLMARLRGFFLWPQANPKAVTAPSSTPR